MRTVFIGKGGSGKTTVAAGFVRWLLQNQERVVAIDADVNMHLGPTLGFDNSAIDLSTVYEQLCSYFTHIRTDQCDVSGTTPPTVEEMIDLSTSEILSPYRETHDSMFLYRVGTYTEADVTSSCYHTKLHVLELLLHRSHDKEKDFIVVDATAGIDNVATSLFVAYDLNVIVAEPTLKSVAVARDYAQLCDRFNEKYVIVGNKIESLEDIAFIEEHCAKPQAIFPVSDHVKRLEKGDRTAFDDFVDEHTQEFQAIAQCLPATCERDEYFTKLQSAHAMAENWARVDSSLEYQS